MRLTKRMHGVALYKWFLLLTFVVLSTCGTNRLQNATSSSADGTRIERPAIVEGDHNLSGDASYYADRFNGRKTASGELYDSDKLTAAHRTLPFGTMVKVVDPKTNRSVIVRINDRGPYSKKRVIDLSGEAAREIDMIRAGVVHVEILILQ